MIIFSLQLYKLFNFLAPAVPPPPAILSQTTESITLNISGPSEGHYDNLFIVVGGAGQILTINKSITVNEVKDLQPGREYQFHISAIYKEHTTLNNATVTGYTGRCCKVDGSSSAQVSSCVQFRGKW